MSQYTSRIHIKVSSPDIWKRFVDTDDAEFNLAELADTDETSFVITGDWSCVEDELDGIVTALAETIQADGLIVADTTNINVDPYAYIVYSMGSGVHKNYHNGDFCFETNIDDLEGYLSYKNYFPLNATELENLNGIGLERVKEGKKYVFRKILINEGLNNEIYPVETASGDRNKNINEGLNNEIYLVETASGDRNKNIEEINVGDAVTLKHNSGDKDDPNCVEVFAAGKSIGLLEAEAADIMAPLLDTGKKEYTAAIVSALPLSKRAKGRRSSVVSIRI